MAGLKEIKGRLHSVRNTKKITYAMKLVSAAKLKKAQEAVGRSRLYTSALKKLLGELLGELGTTNISQLGVSHPLMDTRAEVKNVRLLVVGGSRGLCGGYNSGINKRVEALIREKGDEYKNASFDAVLVGRKPAEYYRRTRRTFTKSFEDLVDDPTMWPADEIFGIVEKDFIEGRVDEVILVYTQFKSAISMTVMAEKLLPMDIDSVLSGVTMTQHKNTQNQSQAATGVTLFEPSINDVWQSIVPRLMRSRIRQAFLDAKASEHGSRMTAMDSATKNSGDIIKSLQLTYNKLRQGRITSELLDIIGGAEALK